MLNILNPCRLFIMGASGTGTTTLGRAIANEWAVPHADADDYFWQPTSPPYRDKRAPSERISLMREVFLPRSAWVFSGSIMGWGEELVENIDAVVFLTLDPASRMSRLEARETVRWRERATTGRVEDAGREEFLSWARGYDHPDFAGRNRDRHDQWLARLSCPVLRLDSSRPVDHLVHAVTSRSITDRSPTSTATKMSG
jgi:adenylate kinase family enzyme